MQRLFWRWLWAALLLTIIALTPARVDARGCVAAGVMISTPDGSVPIEKLRPGDQVLSATGDTLESAKVAACFAVPAVDYLGIHVDGIVLRVTGEHPVQIAAGVFREAASLHVGDTVFLNSANGLVSRKIDAIVYAGHGIAFNLLVAPTGTFLANQIIVHNKGCFLPETPILRADRTSKPISSVRSGDVVMAFEPDDDRLVPARVQAVMSLRVDDYFQVHTDAVTLDVTAEHPFFVGDGTFKTLAALQVGQTIYAYDGVHGMTRQIIRQIDHIKQPVTVYNLQTDEPHTFFANGIAVHNKGGGGGGHGGGGGGHGFGGGGGGYGGSGGDPVLGALVFILVAVGFLVFATNVQRSSLTESGSSWHGVQLDYVLPRSTIAAKAESTSALLSRIAEHDRSVRPDLLEERVRSTFLLLEQCWESRVYEPMRPLLMPDLYETHLTQLNAMIRQHEVNHMDHLQLHRVDFVNARYAKQPDQREITALITASCRDYFTDDRTGVFLRGDRSTQQFQEFWIFHWKENQWLLREIEQSRESDALHWENFVETGAAGDVVATPVVRNPRPFSRTGDVGQSRLQRTIDELARRDSAWEPGHLLSMARDATVAVLLAQENGEISPRTEAILSPELSRALHTRMEQQRVNGESVEYRNLCVRKVMPVLVRPRGSGRNSEWMARVSVHAQKIVYRGGAIVRSDPHEIPFEIFLNFCRNDQGWRLCEILPPTQGEQRVAQS